MARYWLIDKAKGTAKLMKLNEVLAAVKLEVMISESEFAWCIEECGRCDTDEHIIVPEYNPPGEE